MLYCKAIISSQPHLLGLPVVAPYSEPIFLKVSPISLSCSVGYGPYPTRVVYALTTPNTEVIAVGGMPNPVQAPPLIGFEEVT